MRTLSVYAEHRYEVAIGVNALDKIKEIAKLHNKVLLMAPNSSISSRSRLGEIFIYLALQMERLKKVYLH
jgi:hypothetical protein